MKSLFNCNRIKVFPILLLSGLLLIPFSSFAQDLKIGTSSVKITPPVGILMAGQYYDREAVAIHDDLYAKALVIEKDGLSIAIVSCDLVDVSGELVSEIRGLAEKLTGIKADHIMISATHSHTGPVIPYKGNINTREGALQEILSTYLAKLPSLIAGSIKQANDGKKTAKISFGRGVEGSISFNRRFFMKDGTVGWNPGKSNPQIIKPAGPIDPDVSVLYAEDLNGKSLMTYVNFALHLDIMSGLEISADMPFILSTILGEVKSKEMVTLFSQGCCGNINHLNVSDPEPQWGFSEIQRIGTVLAGEVIKTYTRLDQLNVDKIKVKKEIVMLPLAEIAKDDVPWAREIISKYGEADAVPFMDFVNAFKIVDIYERNGNPIEAEIQAFALGDSCAVISLPGEIFTELGMYIKSRSPYPYTVVVELTNGSIDYIPDRKAFVEGNYEPISARCAPGSGEILVEHALNLLNEMHSKKL